MKKIVALLLALIIMTSVLPTYAATTAPTKVTTTAKKLMRDNGTESCFIIKLKSDRTGTAYMMRKTSKGKIVCDRSGAVILGKNTPYNKNYHYSFYRNRASEFKTMKWKQNGIQYRQRYTSNIICAEGAAFDIFVHSYVEYKQNGTWKTCKGASKNTDGLAMCKEFAEYLWSCADPGCPVAII